MQLIFKNQFTKLPLPDKLKQNIKQFSGLIKSADSTALVPLSTARQEQIIQPNRKSSVFDSPAAGYSDFRVSSIKIKKLFVVDLIQVIRRNYSTKMAPIMAPTVKLNNGYDMPVLGLGTYELKKQKCENAIRAALNIGYRHIDTAYLYRNESLIGKILREKIADATIKREEIFLVTKLWNIYHEPKMVKNACKMQMQALQVEYIDLYLMHSPIGYKYENDEALKPHEEDKLQTNNIDFVETYKAMEELVSLGWVRSLGLSNFNIPQMQRVLDECQIIPVTNQVECHPALNQQKLRHFCKQHDIWLTAYSPLARPKATKPLPAFYDSLELKTIAKKYCKTEAQVVLRYLIDIGTVPIPKSSQTERLLENINIFDFQLSHEEIVVINSFDIGMRLWRHEDEKFHKYFPFNAA